MSLGTATSTAFSRSRDKDQRIVDVLKSEWVKLRSVRSSWVTLLVTFVLTIGLSALLCQAFAHRSSQLSLSDKLRFDPAFYSVTGVLLAQVSIGVLGVLTMSNEKATGMIRLSLAAVPRRGRLFGCKAVVFLFVSLVVGFGTSLISFLLCQAIFSGHTISLPFGASEPMSTTLGAPGSFRVVLAAAAYLGAIGLMGLGLGTLIRRTAGAIAALFGILLVVPIIVSALPSPWDTNIAEYLPDHAGTAMLRVREHANLLSPSAGLAVLLAYVVFVLGLGLIAFVRRDA